MADKDTNIPNKNEFIGRCDNCNTPLYSDSRYIIAEIGQINFTLCERCFSIHGPEISLCYYRNLDKCNEYCEGWDTDRECYRPSK